MLSVTSAKYLDNYRVQIEFSDGRSGTADLSEVVLRDKPEVFSALRDKEKFQQFAVNYTLTWPGDLDIAPEYLFFKAFEHDPALQAQFQKWGYASPELKHSAI